MKMRHYDSAMVLLLDDSSYESEILRGGELLWEGEKMEGVSDVYREYI